MWAKRPHLSSEGKAEAVVEARAEAVEFKAL